MNTKDGTSGRTVGVCPVCGSAANAFGIDGVCLRCAGVRVLEAESGTPWESPRDENPLERIGPYEIIEELGRGGMGRVVAARQPGLGRIVAVKAIREGVNPDLDLRFMREIQTVARLRHPNIVVVHESGRANGSLYFSMDYIEGGDLAARLRVELIPVREAAALMAKVADALSYSHGQGVLHRDLKPSNILLDGSEPMLADFGLASQIEAGGDLTQATRILGTPHYLAPEAITGGSAAQTVASDIYSFGVVLYEMLTGRTPFAGASSAELPALVKHSEPPAVRLLAPHVPRDLETICLKCLERDPARRYPTAAALADDLRHYLEGRPIVARPASAWYKVLQFGRRHRLAVGASGAFVCLLVVATAVSITLAARAQKAERKAAAESETSRAVVDFLTKDLLTQASPDMQPDRDITLRTVVDRAAAKVADRLKGQPRAERSIQETLALTYDSLGEYATERTHLERAIELEVLLDGPDSRDALNDEADLAALLARTGSGKEALLRITRVHEDAARTYGPDDKVALHAEVAMTFICAQAGDIEKAEHVAKDALERATRVLGPTDQETLNALSNLSSMYFWEGRYAEAEPLNRQAIGLYTKVYGPDSPMTLTLMGNLAAVYANEDRVQEAQDLDQKIYEARRRIQGADHPDTLRVLNNLGAALRQNGHLAQAEEANGASYRGRLRLMGASSPETLMSESNYIWVLLEKGQGAQARSLAEPGLEVARRTLGPDHHATLGLERVLAEIDRRDGRLAEAQALARQMFDSRVAHGGPKNYNTLTAAGALAEIMVQKGEGAEAEKLLKPVLAAWKETRPDDWRYPFCQSLMGGALAAQGRVAEAIPVLTASADALEKRLDSIAPTDRRFVALAERRAAAVLRSQGMADAAAARERLADAIKTTPGS